MIEMPKQKSELFPQYREEINKISSIYGKMSDRAIDDADRTGVLVNPAIEFTKVLRKIFEEEGITNKLEDFGAYHYAKGSSLHEGDNVPYFDTEDNLIQRSFEDFEKTFLMSVQ